MKTITLNVELNDEQAYQFAQFLKRVSWHDYRELSTSDAEAKTMVEAGELVRTALAEAGYAPR
jgi:hypothetical protein